ncbi:MAG: hypothetical protein FWF18_04025 [Dehalococcoidia bacterium]|nr:hypothetical protein [Dehalococcoidia bacterium]
MDEQVMLNKLTKGMLHKFIALTMAACLLFTSAASAHVAPQPSNVSLAEQTFTQAVRSGNSWETKINDELWEAMAEKSEDDLIPIDLRLKDIDQRIITNALTNETGMDPAIYEDPARFEKEVTTGITRQLEEQLGYEAANVKDEHGMSSVDWAISDKADEYLMAYRRIVKREYSALTSGFIADNVGEKQRSILFMGTYVPCITLEATKSEIEAYARQEIVTEISLYVEWIGSSDLGQTLTQVGADSTSGTKSGFYNSGADVWLFYCFYGGMVWIMAANVFVSKASLRDRFF